MSIIRQEPKPPFLVESVSDFSVPAKPFLRWAGGKRWLIPYIQKIIPDKIERYFEPFLGGGSIFFSQEKIVDAYLSDLNERLIETYIDVRDNVEKIIEKLKEFENTEVFYYKIRTQKFRNHISKAAQFIYLNKTSFNGIYRVNKNGDYNVPYGFRKNLDFIDEDVLRKASQKLRGSIIKSQDFGMALRNIKQNDLVFIDPPYTVAHENNGFILYNQKLFSFNDQKRIANWLNKINEIGAYFIVSNASHKSIAEIYSKHGKIKTLKRMSLIGGKGATRNLVSEYIITNI